MARSKSVPVAKGAFVCSCVGSIHESWKLFTNRNTLIWCACICGRGECPILCVKVRAHTCSHNFNHRTFIFFLLHSQSALIGLLSNGLDLTRGRQIGPVSHWQRDGVQYCFILHSPRCEVGIFRLILYLIYSLSNGNRFVCKIFVLYQLSHGWYSAAILQLSGLYVKK